MVHFEQVDQSIEKLGSRTEYMLSEVDVCSEDDLRELGPVQAYLRLKFRFGRGVSILALYAMEACLRDCDWRDLSAKDKKELKARVAQAD